MSRSPFPTVAAMENLQIAKTNLELAKVEAEHGNVIAKSDYARIMDTLRQYDLRLSRIETAARTGGP